MAKLNQSFLQSTEESLSVIEPYQMARLVFRPSAYIDFSVSNRTVLKTAEFDVVRYVIQTSFYLPCQIGNKLVEMTFFSNGQRSG